MLDNFFTRRWPWLVTGVVYTDPGDESIYADALNYPWPLETEPPVESSDPTRHWCPVCEPDVDPLDSLTEVWYCPIHRPSTEGTITPDFPTEEWYITEAGGPANKRACDIIHRGHHGA